MCTHGDRKFDEHARRRFPPGQIGAEPILNGWEFFVRDDGPGIAARYHAQIWGLFQTLHSRDRIESTGMGLAIVRKMSDAGTIQLGGKGEEFV